MWSPHHLPQKPPGGPQGEGSDRGTTVKSQGNGEAHSSRLRSGSSSLASRSQGNFKVTVVPEVQALPWAGDLGRSLSQSSVELRQPLKRTLWT